MEQTYSTFKKGLAEMLILCLLREGEMYGYEILQTIHKHSGGTINMTEGSLYLALYRMVDEGLISERRDIVDKRMRVYYMVEPPGLDRLVILRKEYVSMRKGMKDFLLQSDIVYGQ